MARDERGGAVASPLFQGLSADENRLVLSRASPRRLARGAALFRQDDPAEALYLVEAGRIKLTQVTSEGLEVIVRIAGPGELFAAIAALDGKTYPFGATASCASRVLAWTRPALKSLFRELPRLETNVLGVVGAHARESLDRVRELATQPVPQRLARALLRLLPLAEPQAAPGVVLRGVTQQELADLSATTFYTVSRILSQWQAEGLVEVGRGRLTLLAPRRLEQLAG